jgi:cytoskeletal protein CcmA (bactofilin family)
MDVVIYRDGYKYQLHFEKGFNIDGLTKEKYNYKPFHKADITATELLSLKASAVLTGNIRISKIAIESGANFAGNCVMQNLTPISNSDMTNE